MDDRNISKLIAMNYEQQASYHLWFPIRVSVCKVARVAWWMGAYAAPTPKRHYAFSNSRAILKLDLGVFQWKKTKATRDPRLQVETAKVYKDRKGKVRYQGTKSLRSTELLVDH